MEPCRCREISLFHFLTYLQPTSSTSSFHSSPTFQTHNRSCRLLRGGVWECYSYGVCRRLAWDNCCYLILLFGFLMEHHKPHVNFEFNWLSTLPVSVNWFWYILRYWSVCNSFRSALWTHRGKVSDHHCTSNSLQMFVYSKNVHTFLACWSPWVPAQGASLPSRHQTKQCSLSFQRPAQSQNKVIRLDNYGGEVAFDEDKHRIIIQTAFWFWLSSNMFLSQIDRFWACSWVGWDGQGEMFHGWHFGVHGTRGSRKYLTGQIELNLFSKLFRQSWRLPFIPSGDEVYFCKSCLRHVELGGIHLLLSMNPV